MVLLVCSQVNIQIDRCHFNSISLLFLGLFHCHETGGNQEWTLTKTGRIKHHELCLTILSFHEGSQVVMRLCDESENQAWANRNGGLLQHKKVNLCLDTRYINIRGVTAERCNPILNSQKWKFVSKMIPAHEI